MICKARVKVNINKYVFFVYRPFNYAVSFSDYIYSNDSMIKN
jgi:hypothetical protein